MTKRDNRRHRIHCPHCHAPAIVRSSVRITDELSQLYVVCRNTECAHIFAATAEMRVTISHTISPSLIPREGVNLVITAPHRRHVGQRVATPAIDTAAPPAPANDHVGPEVPHPANDDDVSEAVG